MTRAADASADAGAAVERELTRFLRRARASSARLAGEVHPDLDAAGYAVLANVLELGESRPAGVRAAELAEAVGLHKSTMSRNITVLETLVCWSACPTPATRGPACCG